jgi:hypothetical protein
MRRRLLGVTLAVVCALAACSDGGGAKNDGAVDGAVDGASGGTCSAGTPPGQACNALVATGAAVTPTCISGTLPVGQGGTIADGTYVLTASTYYNAASCPTFGVTETVEFAGGCIQVAVGSPFPATTSGTFTVSGNTLLLTQTCFHVAVDGATVTQNTSNNTFTATGTTFTTFSHSTVAGNANPDSVAVFTKQ